MWFGIGSLLLVGFLMGMMVKEIVKEDDSFWDVW